MNRSLGIATAANSQMTQRPWLTIFASILMSFSHSVVSDHCSTMSGTALVCNGSGALVNATMEVGRLAGGKLTKSGREPTFGLEGRLQSSGRTRLNLRIAVGKPRGSGDEGCWPAWRTALTAGQCRHNNLYIGHYT